MKRQPYPSDLTDEQWEGIQSVLPKPKGGKSGRPRTYPLREIWNAIFYQALSASRFPAPRGRLGALLPLARYGPHRGGARRFASEGAPAGRAGAHPVGGDHRHAVGEDAAKRGANGYDAGKNVKGRKRHIVVDTLGLLLAVVVHCAGIQDRDGAKPVFEKLCGAYPRLQLIWADGNYAGQLVVWVAAVAGWVLEIVKRSDKAQGFVLLPHRWIVERTFGWLMKYRRLAKDYEETCASSEAWIRLAMIHLMARRLTTSA
jgi:putative transposase